MIPVFFGSFHRELNVPVRDSRVDDLKPYHPLTSRSCGRGNTIETACFTRRSTELVRRMDVGVIEHGIPNWKCVVRIGADAEALLYIRYSGTDLAAAQLSGASDP